MKKNKVLRVRVTENFIKVLAKKASANRRSVSDLVRIVLEDALKTDPNVRNPWRKASRRLKDSERTGRPGLTRL